MADSASGTSPYGPECGRPLRRPATGQLRLTGRFPATARASSGTITGTVEVTSRVAVRGVVAPAADVFLVRDGRVVTLPVAQDSIGVRWHLVPGRAERLPGVAALVSCDPPGQRLPPGGYELYARVVFTPDDGAGGDGDGAGSGDGAAMEAFGGPWRLRVW